MGLRPLFAQGDQKVASQQAKRVTSTPVRTGRPLTCLLGVACLLFDPCSHREASGSGSGTSMIRLQALRAGGLQAKARDARMLTPSPAFTGQTEFFRQWFRCQAFQPCVRRVTLARRVVAPARALPALRPQGNHFDVLGLGQYALFRSLSVQGDRDRWRYAKANDYSTLRAQGNHPARPTRLPALPSSPAFTGQPRSYVSCASCTAFQPCVHRATIAANGDDPSEYLPAPRSQGKHDRRPSVFRAGLSSPAFTGQTFDPQHPSPQRHFQPCVHRATASPRSFCLPCVLPALCTGKTQTQVLSHPKLTFQPSGSTR